MICVNVLLSRRNIILILISEALREHRQRKGFLCIVR